MLIVSLDPSLDPSILLTATTHRNVVESIQPLISLVKKGDASQRPEWQPGHVSMVEGR